MRAGVRLRQGLLDQALGRDIGGSRESVNKILQSWHKAGWIELGKGSIVIRDMAAIEPIPVEINFWPPEGGGEQASNPEVRHDRAPSQRFRDRAGDQHADCQRDR